VPASSINIDSTVITEHVSALGVYLTMAALIEMDDIVSSEGPM